MLRFALASSFLVACAAEDPGPAAPTDLEVSLLGAGAHLIWQDNSADETEFIIMRQEAGAEMEELSRVPFDTVTYHDEPITSGTTYVYMVIATNEAGDSSSEQVTFVAP